MAPSGPALSIVQYVGNKGLFRSIDTERYFWFKKKILDITNGVSSKSIENRPCACAVDVMHKLYPVTLSIAAFL